ncbi:MAG TPA: glycosyltransferase family 39 protein [Candidatus Krumholzibacteria bacterium]|nr:glycosyltransferase family 39 protein [Candidatus Krumholzibacteria bacterium]
MARRDVGICLALAGLTVLLHLVTAGRGGIFRDELYYLACSEHLDFGYVDQPPLVAFLAWFARHIFGESLIGLRLLPALAAGGTVLLTAGMARHLGGTSVASVLAALMVAVAPIYVSLFGYLSMNAFDVLFWAAALHTLIRLLQGADPRLWLRFGLWCGIGLQNKLSIGLLGVGVLVGLIVAREWRHLRSRWLWLGGGLVLLLSLPHLVWQSQHGWPVLEFMANAMGSKNASLSPLETLRAWTRQMNPFAAPVALAGLLFLLVLRRGIPFRALGWANIVIVVLLVTRNTKPYYLSPLFSLLFAAGSVVVGRLAERRRGRWVPVAVIAVIATSGLALVPLAKPVLDVETYIAYATRLGRAPRAEENHELGRLPQFFADRIGWRELAQTVGRVFDTLPAEDRARACIFGQNYGQAGAIDFYGPDLGLPKAISGHNSYALWGPHGCSGDLVIVIDGDEEDLREVFEEAVHVTTYTCQDCMPYENDKQIWICRRARIPLATLWPDLRHFD